MFRSAGKMLASGSLALLAKLLNFFLSQMFNPNKSVFDFSSHSFFVSGNCLPFVPAVTSFGFPANRIRIMLFVFEGLFATNWYDFFVDTSSVTLAAAAKT